VFRVFFQTANLISHGIILLRKDKIRTIDPTDIRYTPLGQRPSGVSTTPPSNREMFLVSATAVVSYPMVIVSVATNALPQTLFAQGIDLAVAVQ